MKILIINSIKWGVNEVYYDDDDEGVVSAHKWYICNIKKNGTRYVSTHVYRDGKRTGAFLHRMLLGLTDRKIFVDHINHNGLDNRRENLRICSNFQNQGNSRPQKKEGKTSKYKGVWFYKKGHHKKPWVAGIQISGKMIHLGSFALENDAALAYNKAAQIYFGDFAKVNNITEGH